MRSILGILLFSAMAAFAQNITDSLINRSLNMVDLQPFVQQGAPDEMHPRLGVYFNYFPADSVKLITRGVDTGRAYRIWQVMPHWSADNAGMLRNDIVLRVDGKRLEDSVYGPDDVLNTWLSTMHAGDTIHVEFIRTGEIKNLAVPLIAGKITPMPYTAPPQLGAVHNSWLQKTLAEKGLTGWADTIAKQIEMTSDEDFCTVPFTSRPNPFRLNAVTYLKHYPVRVGAYSRLIDQSLWDGVKKGPGLAGAIDAADAQLGCTSKLTDTPNEPKSVDDLKKYFAEVQTHLDRGYAPVREKLGTLSHDLAQLLNPDTNWEDGVDTVADPALQKTIRLKVEKWLAGTFGDADKVDLSEVISGAEMLAALADTNWVRSFAQWVKTNGKMIPFKIPGVDGNVVMTWETPEGKCVVGDTGRNRYYGDFAFILDLGGDDEYDLPPCKPGAFRFVADVSGNDIYSGSASAGSGVGCVDVLIDCAGNDTYRGSYWSQGSGCLGVGILADYAGDDIYTGHWCCQGAAELGIGLLYEGSGSDHYISDVYSQGFAYMKGFGMLLENSGNDSYRAGWKYPDSRWPNRAHLSMSQGFGFGMRPWSTGVGTDGGIGVLSDRQGDDDYNSDLFSQGGSYWYGLGILHDWQGSDRYSAGQYSQGSGIHLSFAALLDDSGDDSYDAYAWLEQGNAHDWSSGCLEDWQGNDTYRCSGASQGCGFFVSFGYLLDGQGDDRYYIKGTDTTNSQGGGNYIVTRHSGSLGVLMDLGHGDDHYTDPRAIPGTAVVKSSKGILYDDGAPEKK